MAKRPKMTLKAIAEEMGLSVTTISRALRSEGEISEKTRRQVVKVAKQMQYRPNLLIKGMQTGKTRNAGVMVPPYNPYWAKVLNGIHDGLIAGNHVALSVWSMGEDNEGKDYVLEQIHRLIDRRVDGFILWPKVSETYGEHLDELQSRELPVVTIDHKLSFADSVETDEELGAKLTVEHLYKLGHRSIVHIAGSQKWSWAKMRRECFEKQVAKCPGLTCKGVESEYDEQAAEIAKKVLLSKSRPTAILACNDTVAFEVYTVAAELKIRIPKELSIVGYSDTHKFGQLIDPPLTTIRQYPYETGVCAANILLDRMNDKNKEKERKRVRISCELVVRGSTSKPLA